MTRTSCYRFEYNLHIIKIPSHLDRESIYTLVRLTGKTILHSTNNRSNFLMRTSEQGTSLLPTSSKVCTELQGVLCTHSHFHCNTIITLSKWTRNISWNIWHLENQFKTCSSRHHTPLYPNLSQYLIQLLNSKLCLCHCPARLQVLWFEVPYTIHQVLTLYHTHNTVFIPPVDWGVSKD